MGRVEGIHLAVTSKQIFPDLKILMIHVGDLAMYKTMQII